MIKFKFYGDTIFYLRYIYDHIVRINLLWYITQKNVYLYDLKKIFRDLLKYGKDMILI